MSGRGLGEVGEVVKLAERWAIVTSTGQRNTFIKCLSWVTIRRNDHLEKPTGNRTTPANICRKLKSDLRMAVVTLGFRRNLRELISSAISQKLPSRGSYYVASLRHESRPLGTRQLGIFDLPLVEIEG